MAINTFCTTFCAALFTLAAAPAMAFVVPPETRQDAAPTGDEPYRNQAAFRQPAGHLVLDAGTSAGMLTAEALPGGANDATAQFWQTGAGGMTVRPYAQEESQPVPLPETGNLPLLGAAGVALLVAQLRRSRRPAVR